MPLVLQNEEYRIETNQPKQIPPTVFSSCSSWCASLIAKVQFKYFWLKRWKASPRMMLPKRVRIREVAPRDGFQSLAAFLPTEQKLQIIESLVQAGVREIEATSFVSPKAVPQLKDAAELMLQMPKNGITRAALVANLQGAKNAAEAGVEQVVVVISASEEHNMANVRRSVDESLSSLDKIFDHAGCMGVGVTGAIAVAFGCPYAGDVAEDQVFRLVEEFSGRQAQSVILADTTGMATPTRVDHMVRLFFHRFAEQPLVLHFHNNRGTAMANLLAAVMAGATCFDTALGGIGGCPNVPQAAGNLATEDVVFMLEDMGVETGINLDAIIKAARLLEKILGFTLPGQVMKSGARIQKRGVGNQQAECRSG